MLADLVRRTRSYRKFDEGREITMEELTSLVELSRLTASAANRQPLRYYLINDPAKNAEIFTTLSWAAYLTDWPGPAEGERPKAYIVLCIDTDVSKEWWCDDGIAAQTIMLGAMEMGLGGCMIGAIRHERLREMLSIPDHLKIRLVLALGAPGERVVIDPVGPDGSIKYWRDADSVHHVPKRALEEIILGRVEA